MEFIDKSNQDTFLLIYTDFEHTSWNADDNQYHGYVYDNIPKNAIKTHLINEQNRKCCYCMAKLEDDRTTTLEHVFPQKPIEIDKLRRYNLQCIDSRLFDRVSREEPNKDLTNLPHDISYYNLIASCNSPSTCNSARGNKPISPFFFDRKVNDEFQYDVNGNIFSQKYSEEITTLGLADPDLIKYRKLWRYMFFKNIVLDSNDIGSLKKEIISQALEIGIIEDDIFFEFFIEDNETKVQKALKYMYFYF
jgi:hypothetical protein